MKPVLGVFCRGLAAPIPVLIVHIGMTWEFMEINRNFEHYREKPLKKDPHTLCNPSKDREENTTYRQCDLAKPNIGSIYALPTNIPLFPKILERIDFSPAKARHTTKL